MIIQYWMILVITSRMIILCNYYHPILDDSCHDNYCVHLLISNIGWFLSLRFHHLKTAWGQYNTCTRLYSNGSRPTKLYSNGSRVVSDQFWPTKLYSNGSRTILTYQQWFPGGFRSIYYFWPTRLYSNGSGWFPVNSDLQGYTAMFPGQSWPTSSYSHLPKIDENCQ